MTVVPDPHSASRQTRGENLFQRGRRCAAGLPPEFLRRLEELAAGGSLEGFVRRAAVWEGWPVELRWVDGALEARYPRCLCRRLPPEPDALYCECSRGWLTELLERLFDRPFSVELRTSVLRGDCECLLIAHPHRPKGS